MNFKCEIFNSLIVCLISLDLVAATCIDDWCYLNNGQIGKCQHISYCNSALQELKNHREPAICGYHESYFFPIVCCQQNDYYPGVDQGPALGPTQDNYPLPEQGPTLGPTQDKAQGSAEDPAQGSAQDPAQDIVQDPAQGQAQDPAKLQAAYIADQKCDEFLRIVGGGKGTFIAVGGVDALPMEYPHMAILGYGNGGNNVEWGCGGSLISQEYVLTAAHCLFSRLYGDVTDIRLGDLDIGSTTDDASPQDFKVVQRIPHPDYTSYSSYHDIAVLKLDRPANFTKYVRPACLHTTHNLSYNLTATGWGATYYGGGIHSFLQKIELNELPVQTCQATYKPGSRLLRGVDQELQICAGNLETVMDTCQGDSGGPLQRVQYSWRPIFHRIVGITSFGKNCGLVPAVYTRVSAYIQWITSVVWP